MVKQWAKGIFWISIGSIFYTYIGFPLVLSLRGLLRQQRVKGDPSYTPNISVIVAAHNEAEMIIQKLDNLVSTSYPHPHLEIIVASDGSDDGTNELVAAYHHPQVRLLALPRQGKNKAISQAALTAQGEILVFTDADSLLPAESLSYLIAPFTNPEIGGVAGDYRHAAQKDTRQEGERAYWNYDRMLKQLQSWGGSVSAASGALYAIRRSLFKPVPSTVTDDFFTAMQVVSSHHRFIFEPGAVAYGPTAPSAKAEFRRKVRIMTRGLYGVWLVRHLLNPFNYGFFAIQLFTHKLLRRLTVIPLLLLSLSAPLLWPLGAFYKLVTVGQIALHGAALAGLLLRNTSLGKSKLLSLPFHFDLIYGAAGVALINIFWGKRYSTWGSERAVVQELLPKEELPVVLSPLQNNKNILIKDISWLG
jgi:cellulose synthase/poly-beta-1,6-N-acetylglucosamine synthase-like glycosyltransferase